VVLSLAAWLQLSISQFVFIIVFVTLIWITEALNTVLEIVIDIVSPEFTQAAKRAKDIAAAAVLFAAIGAAVSGIVILGPPLMTKLGF
jgi:diacylglycerol kinase